jgi:thiamine biosynthesis protein ThiS
MRVRVNGGPREVAEGRTLADLLHMLGVAPEGVAVARNRSVVPRSLLATEPIRDGDDIEIVRAVGGG